MKMTKGAAVQEHNLTKHMEKQMGCMAGFFQIFDRNQILTGKRIYSAKSLPPSSAVDSALQSASSTTGDVGSPAKSTESVEPQKMRSTPSANELKQSSSSPAQQPKSPMSTDSGLPLTLSGSEFKEGTKSTWKFSREAPRLSLDSRAIIDAKGSIRPREIRTKPSSETSRNGDDDSNDKQRNSPSVIARLMGLEQLPESDSEPVKKSELRRSASESRVSRDFYPHRFNNSSSSFHQKQSHQSKSQSTTSNSTDRSSNVGVVGDFAVRNMKSEPARKVQQRRMGPRKTFFDSVDVFPEPKQAVALYGEVEKRLKMRGIDEPSKDIEILKQFFETLQLKGLLHSRNPSNLQIKNSDDRESPVPVAKLRKSRAPSGRIGNEAPPSSAFRSRRSGEILPSAVSPRRERSETERNGQNLPRGRNPSSPNRIESSIKSPGRRGPLSIETQRRWGNDSMEQRRLSPVRSPKVCSRRVESDPQITNRSPRIMKRTAEIYPKESHFLVTAADDESSTISESSLSNYSQTEPERFNEGMTLLERCDKLLHNIAENLTTESTELQPSPVSVLDSSFYKEESSPSPIMKRQINFQDCPAQIEDADIWSKSISSVGSKIPDDQIDDRDLSYVSDIVLASHYMSEESEWDIFLLLEKQEHLKGNDNSRVSILQRKLVFDTVNEILDRNGQLPPWKSAFSSNSLQQIWTEFLRVREREESEADLSEVILNVLRKDLAEDTINGWGDFPVEVSKTVLFIERLIFKDLIGETIRDVSNFPRKCNGHDISAFRRRLVS